MLQYLTNLNQIPWNNELHWKTIFGMKNRPSDFEIYRVPAGKDEGFGVVGTKDQVLFFKSFLLLPPVHRAYMIRKAEQCPMAIANRLINAPTLVNFSSTSVSTKLVPKTAMSPKI